MLNAGETRAFGSFVAEELPEAEHSADEPTDHHSSAQEGAAAENSYNQNPDIGDLIDLLICLGPLTGHPVLRMRHSAVLLAFSFGPHGKIPYHTVYHNSSQKIQLYFPDKNHYSYIIPVEGNTKLHHL